MKKSIDCTLVGTCCVDVIVHPVPLGEPLGFEREFPTDPLALATGGLVANCGVAMSRLGARVAAFSVVGDDPWASILRQTLAGHGVDVSALLTHPKAPTGTTAVLVDRQRRHTFAHCGGAPRLLDKQLFIKQMPVFARSRMALIGYYSMLPALEEDLPELLQAVRDVGCQTAMDAACGGGGMQPLERMLPHLDVYFPSYAEARSQTEMTEPQHMIQAYRDRGAVGVVGVKLGAAGALVSPRPGEFRDIPPIPPPGPLVDTVGAGDAFFSGLLVGLLRGMSVLDAGRLAAAAGACCVTAAGANAGLRDLNATLAVAGRTDGDAPP